MNGHENRGQGGYCGDGGPAADACLNTPYSVAFDKDGNLFFSDWGNNRIRRIDRSGIVSTFVQLFSPFTIATDDYGNLYTNSGGRLLRFDSSGSQTVIAGNGTPGFSGDGGPATKAQIVITLPANGVATDKEGNLYLCDQIRVRAVRYGAVIAPPNATIAAVASGTTIRATVFDAAGHPAPTVRVDFTAPASGATCSLSSSSAITDTSGVAMVSCTSNCIEGTYSVTARPLTATSAASVSFTNSARPCRRRSVRH